MAEYTKDNTSVAVRMVKAHSHFLEACLNLSVVSMVLRGLTKLGHFNPAAKRQLRLRTGLRFPDSL